MNTTQNQQDSDLGTPDLQMDQTSLQNGRTTQLYYQRFIKIDECLLKILYCNFAILIVYYEFDYSNIDGAYTQSINVLLYGLTVCAILGTIMLYFREQTKLQLDAHQKKELRQIWSNKRLLNLFLEMIIQVIQPYPWLNEIHIETINYQQDLLYMFKLNYLLVILGLLKIYQIWKIFINSSKYSTPRSNRVAKMYMCESNHGFALKCTFKDYPMKLVTICFFISIGVFSFALRVAERSRSFSDPKADLNYIANSIWLTVITLTTVGYGDISPKTAIGRALVIILVLWGGFIVSIMVAVLNNIFEMDQRELKVLSLIKKLVKKNDIRIAAAEFIQLFWRKNRQIILKRNKHRRIKSGITILPTNPTPLPTQKLSFLDKCLKKSPSQISQQKQKQYIRSHKKKSKTLFNLIKQADGICEEDDVYEDMARQFQCLEDDLKSLNHNQERLTDIIHDKIEQKNDKNDD